jgi:hypothetical protein
MSVAEAIRSRCALRQWRTVISDPKTHSAAKHRDLFFDHSASHRHQLYPNTLLARVIQRGDHPPPLPAFRPLRIARKLPTAAPRGQAQVALTDR